MKQEAHASSEDEVVEVDSGIEGTPLQLKNVKRNLMSSFGGKPGPKSARKERRDHIESFKDIRVTDKLVNGSRVGQVGPVDSCGQVRDVDPSLVNSRNLSRV